MWTLKERPFDPGPGCLSPRAPGCLPVELWRPAAQPGLCWEAADLKAMLFFFNVGFST